ncbi:DUF2780 domain-containing protein [Aliivibrio fischeri]|uniref:DUF2780 domain-containing protein n=1 Tax=Aliivibrio fischeri TaxID=668 RepID=UPI0012D894ED|nr:DUF2780 domain-containing protein [Aliivibrio fischeri]MUL03795.1 DUF2780 domain-containing protein [Aliivibrio fischeri]
MKKTLIFSALALSLTATAPAHAFLSSLFGGNDEPKTEESTASNPLVGMLTENLGISADQAAGGAGALLALAGNGLSSSESSELNSMIPGLESLTGAIPGGLGSMIANMDSVKAAFSALGLDPALISQFTPVIIEYLSSQNASSGLLDSLTSLWK